MYSISSNTYTLVMKEGLAHFVLGFSPKAISRELEASEGTYLHVISVFWVPVPDS